MTGSNQPAIMRRGAAGLREALAARVVVADGAMGTMLQGSDATLEDFGGYEGCNEILNVTRPDLVRSIYDGYLAAGADCISTNSFGANLGPSSRVPGWPARPPTTPRRRTAGRAGYSARWA